jgi:gas vesicle protein GvpG
MGLLTLPFRLPFLPMQAIVRLAEVIQEEAERTYYDPATIRRELAEIERARAAGEISEQDAAQLQNEVVARLTRIRVSGATAADSDEG